jgi:hypothetical protein
MRQVQIKNVIFLSLLGFFLAVLAIYFHHHDNSFLLRPCSICNVKTSISGTFNKVNIDSAPAVANIPFTLFWIFLCLSGIIFNRKNVFTDFPIALTPLNKAPPHKS